MDKKFFIANWKSNKTTKDALEWLEVLNVDRDKFLDNTKEIIICPSFLSIPACYAFINEKKLPIKLGVQNLSEYLDGPYTGEISAKQAKEFCEFAIIGHSERRSLCGETDEISEKKLINAKKEGIISILCVQKSIQANSSADLIAYEPEFAIGTGNIASPDDIEKTFSEIIQRTNRPLIYGGSVAPDNIQSFMNIKNLAGFLIGNASLDPNNFIDLLLQC